MVAAVSAVTVGAVLAARRPAHPLACSAILFNALQQPPR
jgi:hypothetical protein